MGDGPFTSLEAAHEYVGLLLEAVQQTRGDVAEDLAGVAQSDPRQREALQLVAWKLEGLEQHLQASRRLMNDLRRLRRLLLGEVDDAEAPPDASPVAPPRERDEP